MNHIKKIYKSIIFDCDGVILNSNKIKSQAFFEVTKIFGEDKANALVEHHIDNGGISRQEKFSYFLKNIHKTKNYEKDLKFLTDEDGKIIYDLLLGCEFNQGIFDLSDNLSHFKKLVISGGNELEIKSVFKFKKIDKFFNDGIYGNPLSKIEIFSYLLKKQIITKPAIYIGDSMYDWEVASQFGLDFLFFSPWTDLKSWKVFCNKNHINHFQHFNELENYISLKK